MFIKNAIPTFAKALWLTLHLSFFGIIFSILLGFLIAIVQYYKIRFLNTLTQSYIELSRNTPLLIQLFFLYYGLPQIGLKLDSYTCALIGVTFLGGSYMAESFRAGLESVGKIQIESGRSLGLSERQLVFFIILPQSLMVSLPYIGANVIFLLKETSVVSAIALVDVLFVAKDLIGNYYKTSETLFLLVLCYLIVLLPLSILFLLLERHYKRYLG
ncbi:amino acid ABC transporter permease [Helicobacter turcicus]|uniref:Amino acid ABC transporter permease n=1 Tax=Helicobacter turcicus TaxID=2867412 RepID=A0ABS7JKU9_9HELI|nr:amino acid ABC transporter permease [Helicobacter turcicus]MBX7490012.1 amino acid ABC transporter permease [Helicobacter turcicus]MBX7544871.1 amino acid ABC transporter permease [Helicobacter turcicus]